MTSEYYLLPTDESRRFPPDLLARMGEYLRGLPHYVWSDGTFILFRDEVERDSRVPVLREYPTLNDYLDPMVHLDAEQIWLSVVGDPRVDRVVYDFARWCQEQWPSALTDAGEPVPLEVLLEA